MASNRHLGRIIALQTLYEAEIRQQSNDSTLNVEEILDRNISRYEKAIDDTAFIYNLVNGVLDNQKKLDEKIQIMAPDWPIDQVARVDRSILRLGIYELVYADTKVPPKVVINEAIELAKSFGSDNSSKFVNGVLGTAYRTLVEESENDITTATEQV